MQIVVNKDLSIAVVEPEEINQGSSNADFLSIFAPFSVKNYTSLLVYFELPNGEVLKPRVAFATATMPNGIGVWSMALDAKVAEQAGEVKCQLGFVGGVDASTEKITEKRTARFNITVSPGINPELPETPTYDIYKDILSNMSTVNKRITEEAEDRTQENNLLNDRIQAIENTMSLDPSESVGNVNVYYHHIKLKISDYVLYFSIYNTSSDSFTIDTIKRAVSTFYGSRRTCTGYRIDTDGALGYWRPCELYFHDSYKAWYITPVTTKQPESPALNVFIPSDDDYCSDRVSLAYSINVADANLTESINNLIGELPDSTDAKNVIEYITEIADKLATELNLSLENFLKLTNGYIDKSLTPSISRLHLGELGKPWYEIFGNIYYFFDASGQNSQYGFGMYQWGDNYTFVVRNGTTNAYIGNLWSINGETKVTDFVVKPTVAGKELVTTDDLNTAIANAIGNALEGSY